ncbi:hypothetical protein BBO99_00002083 [Phytophthora kernoviae]|uniref:Superoxide dismutase [Fe] n=1 Tax=Phytophthora kernoviae TaxID=325452 RepID=A0A3R7MWU4_9STRA|nr:hypothetical protein JM16_001588 [Phytophthora kernoviae]RLN45509.1 hypothetical protein BBI17_001912 [Phytophthora kernoviae]RLN83520.1 hypothetical protein BBO99_00002083 [Phytophthora kernoviae]
MSFELPKIAYEYNALEPFVDTQTMNIHHTKHHQAYVNNINNYISSDKGTALKGKSILEVVQSATEAPVRNNGGGHYNHSLFWTWMTSVGNTNTTPTGALKTRIEEDFGSLDQMKQEFNAAASSRFGSGWAWLGVKADGKLAITSTPNQDNPLMPGVDQPLIPILGLDVWEHAYYLKYQNRRPEYISAFWNVANWDKVVEYYDDFASKGKPLEGKWNDMRRSFFVCTDSYSGVMRSRFDNCVGSCIVRLNELESCTVIIREVNDRRPCN